MISDDKDTRNNRGLMSNQTEDGLTSRFQMKDLPTEVARAVESLQVGEISKLLLYGQQQGQDRCVHR